MLEHNIQNNIRTITMLSYSR